MHLKWLGNDSRFFIPNVGSSFLFCCAVFWLTGLGLISHWGVDNLHLLTIDLHKPSMDVFFRFMTKLGEVYPVILLLIFIVWKGKRLDIIIFISAFILQLFITQFIKSQFFIDGIRPVLFFERRGIELPLVENSRIGITKTFPSGHTSAAFFSLFCSAQLLRKWYWQIVCFALALLVGLSRVYLWKHFFVDVIAGSIIGVFTLYYVTKLFDFIINRYKKKEAA